MPVYDPATTALILIDLQGGIVAGDKGPRSGEEVVGRAKDLAARFREAGAPVVLVHVAFREAGEMPSQKVSKPMLPEGGTPPAFYELVDGLRQDGDLVVLKHHWGAFTGTDLDLQLRRRGVKTVVIAGIATNFEVESTARSAWELSYDVVIPEDVCTSRSADLHRFAFDNILPAIAEITTAEGIAFDAG